MKPATNPDDFTMPEIRPGQVVLWFSSRTGTDATPAIVQSVADRMLDLLVLPAGSANGLPRGGVRHKDDPNHRAIDNADMGVWDYTDTDKDLLDTFKDLSLLISSQEQLIVDVGRRLLAAEGRLDEVERKLTNLFSPPSASKPVNEPKLEQPRDEVNVPPHVYPPADKPAPKRHGK